MTMGHGAYGVEAGARLYFDKPAKDLTLEEAATHRRDHPDAGAAQPVRQPGTGAGAAQQLRAAADGGRRVHHRRGGDAASGTPARRAGPADARSLDRAVLRRRHPQEPRAEVHRRRAVPGRPPGADDARRRAAGGRQPRASTADCAGSTSAASGYRQAGAQRRRRRARRRALHDSDRWTQPMLAGDIVPGGRDSGAAQRSRRASAIGAHELDLPASASPGPGGRQRRICSSVGDLIEVEVRSAKGGVPETVAARTGAGPRRRAARHRQPHAADPRDGGRVQLRPQQVQPRDAGAPADRLHLQADRLHGRHRSRLHAGLGLHRRAGRLRAGPEPAAVFTAELRPEVRGTGDAAPRARAVAQHSGGEGDAGGRAAAGRRLRRRGSDCGATSSRTSRSRWRRPKQRCSRPPAPTRCFPTRASA